jgi:putative serine protease PepD
MTTDHLAQAFCTACGAALVDSACSRNCSSSSAIPLRATAAAALAAAPNSAAPPDVGRRPWRHWMAFYVALSMVTAILAVLGTAAFRGLDGRLDRLDAASNRLEQEVGDLAQEQQDAGRVQAETQVRLDQLESVNDKPDASAIAKRASKSVFTIEDANSTGSGFVVSSGQGLTRLVTNFHVISDGYVNGDRRVEVRRAGMTYRGSVTDVSESNDLAVVTVSAELPVLPIAAGRPHIGEPVLALGSPLGLGGTVTSGIVSAFRTEGGLEYMQFSAPISPGNSGGPVIDEDGKVLGVAVIKYIGGGAEGLGLAIPADRLCSALEVC